MNVYNFKKIEKCYVFGNIDRNMDRFIKTITSNISKFKKEEHPKEIERQERLKKRQAEAPYVGLGGIHPHQVRANRLINPHDPGPTFASTWDVGTLSKKMSSSIQLDSTYNDSVIIVSGNCGIGNKSKKYYDETFSKLDKILGDNNCFLLFVRGNNDNPSIFNNREIDFEHVKAIPDYSVVAMKTFNCLCIGGSVSMDKEWKLAQEELYGKKLYWEDEAPIYDEEKLAEILEKFNINCIITSTCPSFAYPGTNAFKKSKWFYRDKKVITEFSNERKTMDKIYEKIMDSESKPYMWFYGRFKMGHTDKLNDIVFNSLSPYNSMQINSQLSMLFGIDTSKTLENNGHTFDNIIGNGMEYKDAPKHYFDDGEDMEIEAPELDDVVEDEEMAEEEVQDNAENPNPVFIDAPVGNGAAYATTINEDILNDMIFEYNRADAQRLYGELNHPNENGRRYATDPATLYTIRAENTIRRG